MLIGFRGHLVSEHVLEHRVHAYADGPMPIKARTALVGWRARQRLLGPASSVRTMLEAGASPFVCLLGFAPPGDIAMDDDVCAATLRTASAPVAIVVARWGERLDPLWRRATLESRARGAEWCLLFNGTDVRLIHTVRVLSRRFAEFDLDSVVDDERTASAMWMLLAASAFERTSDDAALVAAIVEQSERHASAVCRALRHGVLQASGDILETLAAQPTVGPLDEAFEQALTIVYRMLFLLFAEARALVPSWHPVYRQSYSLATLTSDALSGSHTGLWDALRAISRLAHSGCVAGNLKVTAFNGRLFAPSRTPLADRPGLDDEAARRSLVALSTRPAPDGEGREPIAYRELGVEQLGAVYETLLDYRPQVEQGPRGVSPVVVLVPGSGVRKATGSFYTPQSIASYLIRRTLAPLVRDRKPEEILDLKVLDPSMGSGAFLVGACRYLADAYEDALVRAGACLPSDLGPDERARIRRTVAERCLYGVDINPMAVQLARLSLWLATLAHDRPLSFLDHHLVVGDSVLGTWMSCLRHVPTGRRPQSVSLPLFDSDRLSDTVRHVLPVRFQLEQGPNDTAGDVRAKERALAALNRQDTLLTKWKRIADLWCGRWFVPELRPPAIFAPLCDEILVGRCELPRSTAESLLQISARSAERRRFFHWELEFPEVFFDASGTRRPDGGFDAVIGNPPWDVVRTDAGARHVSSEAERRAQRAREGAARGEGVPASDRAGVWGGASARRAQRAREGAARGEGVPASDRAGVWGGAPHDDGRAIVRFTREAGVYLAQSDGHANRYQLFLERTIALVRPGGRLGLVLPSGLASDHGSAALRRLLFSECAVDAIVGFHNRRAIFPIHRSLRFVLVSAARGAPTTSIDCHLGEVDPAVLDRAGDQEASGCGLANPLRLTTELIEKISGSGLAIPELRTPVDVAIAERSAELFPAVGDTSGWQARFGRELNATEDRVAFEPPGRGLPVIEGKLIEPFRVHAERARCSLPPREAFRRLGDRHRCARLAYRDVASASNRVTLIAAVLPAGAVSTHTVFCLKTALPPRAQWFLCGMFNSLVVNYLVRLRVTTHVTTSIVERLPMPREDQAGRAYGEVAGIARVLARRHDVSLWARLNASVARLYALDEEELGYVLGTFPLVPSRDRDAVMRAFRTF